MCDNCVVSGLENALYFGVLVGRARLRYHVKAPAVIGDENFERAYRVQI